MPKRRITKGRNFRKAQGKSVSGNSQSVKPTTKVSNDTDTISNVSRSINRGFLDFSKDTLAPISETEDSNNSVSETRSIHITDVIFQVEDFQDLASIVIESAKYTGSTRLAEIRIVIKDFSNAMFSSSSPDILRQEDILGKKLISSISIDYYDYLNPKKPSIRIAVTGAKYSASSIVVSGNDRMWVNAVTRRFEETLSSLEKQVTWPKRYKTAINLALSAFITIPLIYWVLEFIINATVRPPRRSPSVSDMPILITTLLFFAFFALINLLMLSVTDKIVELWPSIEIQTGKERDRAFRNRRLLLGSIISLIIIPLIVTMIYDLIKGLI